MRARRLAFALLASAALAVAAHAQSPGAAALHHAAYEGDLSLVQRLLRDGADPSARTTYGATPLSLAAANGDAAVIRALLRAGADPNEANSDGETALMLVARTGNVEAARALVRAGADVNAAETWRGQTALMWAAHDRHPNMVAYLLSRDADPDARSAVNNWERQTTTESRAQYRPAGGLTPLLFAAREGCGECVRLLVEGGADVNLPDPDEITPLIVAIDNLRFDIAKYLLENGADPGKWDRRGRTPLYVAIDMNTLPHGGRPDQPSADETTALDIARMLLEAGVEVDPQLKSRAPYRDVGADRGSDVVLGIGVTPLFRAAKAFDTDAIALLLEYGADPNLPNVNGITPTTVAAGLGSYDVDIRGRYDTPDVQQRSIAALRLLIAGGGDINHQSHDPRRHVVIEPSLAPKDGQAALHGAAYWGWSDVVRFLVENGADLYATDSNGKTVIDAAMGRAGGNGRGGVNITQFPETAALLEDLMAQYPRTAGVQAAARTE